MSRFHSFSSIELQHLVAALARSPLSDKKITQTLTHEASDVLDRRVENGANTVRYNAAA